MYLKITFSLAPKWNGFNENLSYVIKMKQDDEDESQQLDFHHHH